MNDEFVEVQRACSRLKSCREALATAARHRWEFDAHAQEANGTCLSLTEKLAGIEHPVTGERSELDEQGRFEIEAALEEAERRQEEASAALGEAEAAESEASMHYREAQRQLHDALLAWRDCVTDQGAPDRLMSRWGGFLEDWADAEDLSKRQVAAAIDVSPGTVTRYANGQRTPGLRTVAAQIDRIIRWDRPATDPLRPHGASAAEADAADKRAGQLRHQLREVAKQLDERDLLNLLAVASSAEARHAINAALHIDDPLRTSLRQAHRSAERRA